MTTDDDAASAPSSASGCASVARLRLTSQAHLERDCDAGSDEAPRIKAQSWPLSAPDSTGMASVVEGDSVGCGDVPLLMKGWTAKAASTLMAVPSFWDAEDEKEDWRL